MDVSTSTCSHLSTPELHETASYLYRDRTEGDWWRKVWVPGKSWKYDQLYFIMNQNKTQQHLEFGFLMFIYATFCFTVDRNILLDNYTEWNMNINS